VCGAWNNTIRFNPPLVVNAEQVSQALGIFERVLNEVCGHGAP